MPAPSHASANRMARHLSQRIVPASAGLHATLPLVGDVLSLPLSGRHAQGAVGSRRKVWRAPGGEWGETPAKAGLGVFEHLAGGCAMIRLTHAAAALGLAAAVTAAVVPVSAAIFSDIQGDPNQRGIEKVVVAGVLAGFADGPFRPGRPITRRAPGAPLAKG